MINFVVCSLEKTLLREGKLKISEETIELISRLKGAGIQFAVASGWNYDAVKPLFGKVKNDIVYICNDGGVVIYQEKILSKTPIDRLVCMDVVSEFEKNPKFQLVFAGERSVMVNTHDYDFMNYLKTMGMEPEYVKDFKAGHNDVTKIIICAKDGLDSENYEHFYDKWGKKANVAVSSPEQAFLTAPYVTKGNAIAVIQHLFDISEEDTVVFGSGYSDIDMFGHCFYSYAMQYADPEVRREAKHIAENVDTILEDIMRI